MLGLNETVHLIATPAFDASGCDGARYSSVLVVGARAGARRDDAGRVSRPTRGHQRRRFAQRDECVARCSRAARA
jgi:hypothetical protein